MIRNLIPIEKHKKKILRHLGKTNVDRFHFAVNTKVLPKKFDLVSLCPKPYDQGQLSSCTANAICASYKILETDKTFEPSRMFLYYKERLLEDLTDAPINDSGADAKDGVDFISKYGICPESDWSYIEGNVDVAPPTTCDTDALNHKITSYSIIDNNDPSSLHRSIRSAIYGGHSVLLGMSVYESFMSEEVAANGIVHYPSCLNFDDPNDPFDKYIGGHEVLIVGYNDAAKTYKCLNSWGENWGDKGFFTIPYSYIHEPQLAQEFVVITKF